MTRRSESTGNDGGTGDSGVRGPVAIVTGDLPPIGGVPANGAGLRAWGIAAALRELGVDARLLFPREHLRRGCEVSDDWIMPVARGRLLSLTTDPALLATDSGGDATTFSALIFQHWGLLSEGLEQAESDALPAVPVAIDLAGPHLLERAYWRHGDGSASFGRKRRALEAADFVTFASSRQAAWFALFLSEAWGDAPDLTTVFNEASPASVDQRNEHAGRCDFWFGDRVDRIKPTAIESAQRPLIVFSGAFLPWQDASWAIEHTLAFLDRLGRGELLVIGTELPFVDGGDGARKLAKLVGRHPRARRMGRVPFDRVVAMLRAADASLDLMAANPERVLASPIRTSLALWLGTPVVFNDYGAEAEAVREHGGWAIAPGDTSALEAALSQIAEHTTGDRPSSTCRATAQDAVGDLAQWLRSATNGGVRRERPADRAGTLTVDGRVAVSANAAAALELSKHVVEALTDGHWLVEGRLAKAAPVDYGAGPHAARASAARRAFARLVAPLIAAGAFVIALPMALLTSGDRRSD